MRVGLGHVVVAVHDDREHLVRAAAVAVHLGLGAVAVGRAARHHAQHVARVLNGQLHRVGHVLAAAEGGVDLEHVVLALVGREQVAHRVVVDLQHLRLDRKVDLRHTRTSTTDWLSCAARNTHMAHAIIPCSASTHCVKTCGRLEPPPAPLLAGRIFRMPCKPPSVHAPQGMQPTSLLR